MSTRSAAESTETGSTRTAKGLSAGSVGLIGAVVIGISCIAPAYTLTGALGPTVSEVGVHLPAIFLVGFLPMLLVAFGYRELNNAMPDSGTSFTWATRAFGPYLGWMGGWGLIAATVVVLSNLAGIAVDFLYLLLSQVFHNPAIADLSKNPFINVATCLAFMAVATLISYRDMQTTQKVQYVLVGFQLLVLVLFGVVAFVHVANGTAFDATPPSLDWFNPFGVPSFSAFAAGLSLSIFIFWGWDVTLTMSEETKGSRSTPGRAATLTVVIIVVAYLFVSMAAISFAGTGDDGIGLRGVRDVEQLRDAADPGGDRGRALEVDVGDDDLDAVGGELCGDGRADALSGTGHDRDSFSHCAVLRSFCRAPEEFSCRRSTRARASR